MDKYPSIGWMFFVRHADTGNLCNTFPNLAEKQCDALGAVIERNILHLDKVEVEKYPQGIFCTSDSRASQFTITASFQVPQSWVRLHMLIYGHATPSITASLLDQILNKSKESEANYVIVVGHGNVPAHLARAVQEMIGSTADPVPLDCPENACGFGVNLQTGETIHINAGSRIFRQELMRAAKEALL